jgi:hypothetical protein
VTVGTWPPSLPYAHCSVVAYNDIGKYKYRLTRNLSFNLEKFGITPNERIETPWIILEPSGWMHFREGYCWNGASGPTYDDKAAIYASLPHDGGYQLMNLGLLDEAAYKPRFDLVLRRFLRRKGSWSVRGIYYQIGVTLFGHEAAKRSFKPEAMDVELFA